MKSSGPFATLCLVAVLFAAAASAGAADSVADPLKTKATKPTAAQAKAFVKRVNDDLKKLYTDAARGGYHDARERRLRDDEDDSTAQKQRPRCRLARSRRWHGGSE